MKKVKVLVGVVIGLFLPLTIGASTKNLEQVDSTEFSQEVLENMLIDMNFKYPHIVYAQAILETANFTSKNFKEDNNMFGMKRAKSRITTALKSSSVYAVYDSWESSLIDYALYQSRYIYRIKSEQDYYEYLKNNYASDPEYVEKLKNIIRLGNLVEKFSKKS
jgi:flagellum-specific peptidoglycan hydrolase FlgJ